MLTWHDRVLVDFEGVAIQVPTAMAPARSCASRCARERDRGPVGVHVGTRRHARASPFPINIAEHWSATVAHGSHHRPHPPSFLSPPPPFFVLFGGGANPDRPPPLTLSVGPAQVDRKKKQNNQCSSFS
ncbi:unnamed protein product [Musa acuminata subsp. burmannicoides]